MQLDVSRGVDIVYFYQVEFGLWQSPGKGCHVIEAGVRHDEFKVGRSCPFKSAWWWNCCGLQVLHVFPPYDQKSISRIIVLCNKQKAGPSFCWYFTIINNWTWPVSHCQPLCYFSSWNADEHPLWRQRVGRATKTWWTVQPVHGSGRTQT